MNTEARHLRTLHRFLHRVKKDGECWMWQGAKFPDGYGVFHFEGRPTRAHRVSHAIFVGPVGDGKMVMHTCDRPLCVNPDHLREGTPLDNVMDAYEKGRKNDRGSKNGWSKLTEDQVVDMRQAYAAGETQTSLARRFSVHQGHVSAIVRRVVWRHV